MDKRTLLAMLGGLLAAVAVFVLMSVFFQKTVYRVTVKGHFQVDTIVKVSSVSSSGNVGLISQFEFKGGVSTKPQHQGTRVINTPIARLQLDFKAKNFADLTDQQSRQFSLHSIQVPMPYSVDFYYGAGQIPTAFESVSSVATKPLSYEFDPQTGQASIRTIDPVGRSNLVMVYGLPILFFFGIWFLLMNSAWSQIPAFKDMNLGNRISTSREFDTINGVRGLAALLVLLSHTAPGFEALQMGLALLFVISGFLLSKPFVMDSSKIFSFANLERYITKRLKRILPMYYLFVFITYVLTFKFDVALRHFLFIQAEGHLWPMTQIFAFYMLLPLVLLITSASHKIHRLLPLLLLGVTTYLSVINMRGWTPFFNGQYSHEFFLYAFLMGVFASYVQYDLIGRRSLNNVGNRWLIEAVGMAGLLMTITVILWSAPMKPDQAIFKYVSQFYIKCIASVAILLFALNTPGSIFNKLMANWIFRSVGVVGFSFYILHGLGMQIADNFALQFLGNNRLGGRSWEFVAGAFVATYLMAIAAYSYVERPFFGYREKSQVK